MTIPHTRPTRSGPKNSASQLRDDNFDFAKAIDSDVDHVALLHEPDVLRSAGQNNVAGGEFYGTMGEASAPRSCVMRPCVRGESVQRRLVS